TDQNRTRQKREKAPWSLAFSLFCLLLYRCRSVLSVVDTLLSSLFFTHGLRKARSGAHPRARSCAILPQTKLRVGSLAPLLPAPFGVFDEPACLPSLGRRLADPVPPRPRVVDLPRQFARAVPPGDAHSLGRHRGPHFRLHPEHHPRPLFPGPGPGV